MESALVANGAKLYLSESWSLSKKFMTVGLTRNEIEPTMARPVKNDEPHWYVVHTSANHEKRVSEQFMYRGVEYFLPQYETVRRWKDRRMRLQLPLFPGYVFVRMTLGDRLRVLQVPGVARLVGFNGLPCALPEEEIQAVQNSLNCGYPVR